MGDGFASMCWQLEIKATNFAKEKFSEIKGRQNIGKGSCMKIP